MGRVMAWRIGGKVRALRKRRGWRQQDLAGRLGWSRELISRIENDRLDNVPFGKVQACINALGGFLRTDVLWHGEQLHRLMDARHAAIQNALVRLVESLGWTSRVEVSFNHYGDRGRIDVMAWHPRTGSLAVVEVESVLGDVQDTLGRLDVKVRLAREIAGGIGWTVSSVVPWPSTAPCSEGSRCEADRQWHGCVIRAGRAREACCCSSACRIHASATRGRVRAAESPRWLVGCE